MKICYEKTDREEINPVLFKKILSRNKLQSESTMESPQNSCPHPSSLPKKTIFTEKFDHDNQQGWQQEAVGFGPFWSEYDMWL